MKRLMKRETVARKRTARVKLPRPGRKPPAKHSSEAEFRAPLGQWTNGSNLKTKAATVGLLLALALSPAGVVVGLAAASSGSSPSADNTAVDTRGEQAAVEEFAGRFVTTWLSANADNFEERLGGLVEIPDSAEFPTVGWVVTEPTIAGVTQVGDGTWSVTVAVTTATSESDPGVRRFYSVPVVYDAGQLAALALPAPTAAPTMAEAPELDYPGDLSSTHPAWRTVAGFMTALLAGSGDINRYLTPGTHVAPVVPVPFSEVRISQLATQADVGIEPANVPGDGEQLAVLVTAAGVTADSAGGLPVQYALVLTGRDGRWEVTEVEASPQLEGLPGDVSGGPSADGSPAEEEQ